MLRQVKDKRNPYYSNKVASATVTLTAEAANARTATVQLKSNQVRNLTALASVYAWLSDAAGGGLAAAAPSGGVAAGAAGAIHALVAGKSFMLVTDVTGAVELVITEATAKTFYLNVLLPSGEVSTTAVAFA